MLMPLILVEGKLQLGLLTRLTLIRKKAAAKSHYYAQPAKKNAADRASYRANCDAQKVEVRARLSCKFIGK